MGLLVLLKNVQYVLNSVQIHTEDAEIKIWLLEILSELVLR